jgi:hypothetical protein
MTSPGEGEPAPYEYKIIRSSTAAFRKPAALRAALEEEARAGWELLEKFDDSRVRLRRHVKWRERDGELSQDPYRTRVGVSEGMLAVWILMGVFLGTPLLLGLIALLVALTHPGH